MYSIIFTNDGGLLTGGYQSEAEAVRAALDANDPQAIIEWDTERQELGTAEKLAKELDLDLD